METMLWYFIWQAAWIIGVLHMEHENIYKERTQSDFENFHLLLDIENALSSAKLMTSDKVQATNLKDALKEFNIHLNSEDQELLEKTLNVDGKYNHCQPVCLNNVAPVIKLRVIHLSELLRQSFLM